MAKVQEHLSEGGFTFTNTYTTGALGSTPTPNNLLIAVIWASDDVGLPFTSSGWTQLSAALSSEPQSFGVLYKLAGSSEPTTHAFAWTTSALFFVNVHVSEWDSVNATPIDVAASGWTNHGFTASDITEPAITTVTNGAIDVVVVSTRDSGPGYAMVSPSGYAEENDSKSFGLYTKTIAALGSTGSRVLSHPTQHTMSFSFAIRPSGGGGGNPWYYRAQQRVKTEIDRQWERRGPLWTPSYAMKAV